MLIALVGGTLISIAIGYLIAYGKEFFEKSSQSGDFESWSKGFDRMVGAQKADFRDSGAERSGFSTGQSRAQSTDRHGSYFEQLAQTYENLNMSAEAQYFERLKSEGRDFFDQECKKRSSEFKRKWGHSVSDHYLRERFIELCRDKAFIQNKNLKLALPLKGLFDLWESYAGAYLLLDDARLGSSTLSKDLEKKLALDPFSIYRGIEYWFLTKAGQSKASLVQEYWRDVGRGHFQRSQKVANWSESRRIQIILSLVFPARHKVRTFPEVLKECEGAISDLESELRSRGRQDNQEGQSSSSHKKQKSKKQTSSEHPKAKKSSTPPSDFSILGIEVTSDWEEIKKAYRKMAMKYHPDRVDSHNEQEAREAHDFYVEIQKAYERLEKRYGKKAA